ncbi:MAG: GNAT family N-acetyltransferase [Firmicutes bacterium]|nr:GNAT family N-acetyltransferase [Bacillota bacterium]
MIRLEDVSTEKKELLRNINQKYLYEMTQYYDDPMDSEGNYHYGCFDKYFEDPLRKAFFIYSDAVLVGFAMINPYSFIGEQPDHVMAEFTIFPAFRGRHYGRDAARLLMERFPGRWEIKFNEKNIKARSLWMGLAEPFGPKIHHLNAEETVIIFSTASAKEDAAMYIRKSTMEDVPRIMEIIVRARKFMAETGNPTQWYNDRPRQEEIEKDIANGTGYVCVHEDRIIGTFHYNYGDKIEPFYNNLIEGEWIDDSPYAVIHRIASDGTVKGTGAFCLNWALEQCGHIRIDTHPNNKPMQGLLNKLQYTKCCVIPVKFDGSVRWGYEKSALTDKLRG